ncbi:MAG: B12-binding domain-containing radical SAM protein [Candidatus Margulisbacteria bacterium]|nr:B12-binding domain-containing radical SAM protein [Candidatus Margulisiibacteriota bacterium]
MRIALVQTTRVLTDYYSEKAYVPLNLLSLASYLKERNFRPYVFDFNVLLPKGRLSKDFFKSAAKRILRCRPKAIGFSVTCASLPASILVANECKKLSPGVTVILGGQEVSFEEEAVLEAFRSIDIVVRGEGEATFTELLQALGSGMPLNDILGLTYRDKDQILRNPDRPFIEDLDSLPLLDFSLLPHIGRYEQGAVEAGRGCPYCCSFCANSKMWKRSFRIKSPPRIVKELKNACRLFKKDRDSFISIAHDNFLADRRAAETFLDLMSREKIAWSCSARVDLLDSKLIKNLRLAGCKRIFLGVETGSFKMQKAIRKNVPLNNICSILGCLEENGILAVPGVILGFPRETIKQIDQTLLLCLQMRISAPSSRMHMSLLILYKGSELFLKARHKFSPCSLDISEKIFPTISGLPAELKLAREYPLIFPSFNYLKNCSTDPGELLRTKIIFGFLVAFLPRTTMALIGELFASPFRLGQDIYEFLISEGLEWQHHSKQATYFKIKGSQEVFCAGKKVDAEEILISENPEILSRVLKEYINMKASNSIKRLFKSEIKCV